MEEIVQTMKFSEAGELSAEILKAVEKMGFTGPLRIENDRGPGIDTVYYHFYRKGDSRP